MHMFKILNFSESRTDARPASQAFAHTLSKVEKVTCS